MKDNISKTRNPSDPPLFYGEDRTAIIIEGSSIYAMAKSVGHDINYRKLREYVALETRLIRSLYYSVTMHDQNGVAPLQQLHDFLAFNGWVVRDRPVTEGHERAIKANMSMEIATDLFRYAGKFDHIILFSGNGDLVKPVEMAQECGARLTLVGTLEGDGSMVSNSLRKQADHFVDIFDHDFGGAFKRKNVG